MRDFGQLGASPKRGARFRGADLLSKDCFAGGVQCARNDKAALRKMRDEASHQPRGENAAPGDHAAIDIGQRRCWNRFLQQTDREVPAFQ